jgi:hypothetical protein
LIFVWVGFCTWPLHKSILNKHACWFGLFQGLRKDLEMRGQLYISELGTKEWLKVLGCGGRIEIQGILRKRDEYEIHQE